MVTAKEVMARYDIPRGTFYRLIKENRIPYQTVTKDWHKRPQYRFCLPEIDAALRADHDASSGSTG